MITEKTKMYFLEIILLAFSFFTLFASYINTRWLLAIFLIIFVIASTFLMSKKKAKSIYSKQVTFLMLIFAVLYLGIFYLLGLYFGFQKSKYIFGIKSIYRFIIPTIIVIICSEDIRHKFLLRDGEFHILKYKINLSQTFIYMAMVLIDTAIYVNIYVLSSLDDYLMAIGFVLFAALSNNLLFNYISSRFGSNPNIVFRLLTVLYIYFIPVIPSVFLFFRTFLRMLYPFIIYLVLEWTYAKTNFAVSTSDKRKNVFWTFLLMISITLVIMLISCQFRFGIIVIGSESMTGTINVGDAVIFEKYDLHQKIENGQIVIFEYNGIKTIHRVVEIRIINGETRYYTKGDANKEYDSEYRLPEDIDGLVKLRIKYIGKPTIWIRSLFD